MFYLACGFLLETRRSAERKAISVGYRQLNSKPMNKRSVPRMNEQSWGVGQFEHSARDEVFNKPAAFLSPNQRFLLEDRV